MTWLQMPIHSSQMYTFGPATSFFTSISDLPQKEQRSAFSFLRVKSLSGDSVPIRKRIALTFVDGPAIWGLKKQAFQKLLAVSNHFVNQAVLFGLHG